MSDDTDEGFGPVFRGGPPPGEDPGENDDDWLPADRGQVAHGRVDHDRVAEVSAPVPVGEPDAAGHPDDDGPVMRGRRRLLPRRHGRLRHDGDDGGRPVGRRLLRVGGGVLVVVGAFLVGLAALAAIRVDRVEVAGLSPGPGGTANVLLVGSDSREGLSDEELLAIGTEAVEGRRTDTILLLSVRGGRAAALSFPRDLVARRCDGTTGRINGAYASGGPSCLVQTVQELSGIPVSHYAEVDFAGFLGIVDAVGGVQVQLDEPLVDRFAGVDLPAGCQVLDGRQSLGFVRSRKVDSDLGRIARQQRFVAQLARSVVRPATLANPLRLTRFTVAAADAVTVDGGFGPLTTLRLARAARGVAGGGLATVTVPARPSTLGGAAVLVPTDEAMAVFAGFADGSVLTPPPAAAAPPAPDPGAPPEAAPGPVPPDPGATDQSAVGAGAPPPACEG